MKLDLERSGGLTGIIKTVNVDTEDLPVNMARTIEKCVSKLKSDDKLLKTIRNSQEYPDSYCYKLTRKGGNKKEEIEFREFDVDKEFKSILNYLFKKY